MIVYLRVVCWMLNVPATWWYISGTDQLGQLYVLPHWDRSCRSNFLPHPVTVYWHRADQSQHWPGTWQGSHWSANFFHRYYSTRKYPKRQSNSAPQSASRLPLDRDDHASLERKYRLPRSTLRLPSGELPLAAFLARWLRGVGCRKQAWDARLSLSARYNPGSVMHEHFVLQSMLHRVCLEYTKQDMFCRAGVVCWAQFCARYEGWDLRPSGGQPLGSCLSGGLSSSSVHTLGVLFIKSVFSPPTARTGHWAGQLHSVNWQVRCPHPIQEPASN